MQLNSRKMKLILLFVIFALLGLAWASIHGIDKTIEKTISVDVYEENDRSAVTSSIMISGNLRRTLFSASFVGTFAMEYDALTCRDGVEAKIKWQDKDHQSITFFYAGDFSGLDVEMIRIDREMERMMIVLKDGTIITSPNYYIPTQIWKQYKS